VNRELIVFRQTRAKETLQDALLLAKSSRWNACVNRLYYACFYAVSALLLLGGQSSTRHTGVRALFNLHFVRSGIVSKDLARIFNDLFERRQEGDYVDFVCFEEEQVGPWLAEGQRFVREINALIEQELSKHIPGARL
jgi:uncharacterized protein (UPF0332 family)